MQITASAISLDVDDVTASTTFVKKHFGFSEDMSADSFVSLSQQDAGFNLIFLLTGLDTTVSWSERFFQVTDLNGVVLQLRIVDYLNKFHRWSADDDDRNQKSQPE